MIKIDGSFGSGGGQILRTATALSAITKKPVHIFNIRKGREKPGLKTQHLLGLRALAKLSQGFLQGDQLESEEIKLYPGEIGTKKIKVRIKTAGSITLVLQSLLPVALFAKGPIEISFRGGATDTFFSPTFDYFRFVSLGILEKMGVKRPEIELRQRGFYPTGGAKVDLKIFPSKLEPIFLTKRGRLKRVLILSGASKGLQKKKVAERQITGVKGILSPKLKLPTKEKAEYYKTTNPGSKIDIIGDFENTVIGVNNLGKLGKPAEKVGKEAAKKFLQEAKSEACLDKHMADQVLPYLALIPKKSVIAVSEITDHCKTNIWVIEKFLDGKFRIEDNLISWIPE